MGLILPNAPQFSQYESNIGATPGIQPGTGVNHYASGPHVKNTTYTQLIASTAFDAQLVVVTVTSNSVSNGDSSTLLDIAIGAASSETVIIPDLCAGFATSGSANPRYYIFPLYVPAGSRISARTQSIRTSGSVTVLYEAFGGPLAQDRWWCGQQVTAYGVNAANSAGTKFTPGNSGAEGTGVSLGTTSADHQCFVLGVQGHPDDTSWSGVSYHFDIGVGSTSTAWFAQDRFQALSLATEAIGQQGLWWPIFQPIPSGTEIMIQGECSGTADALSAAVYGVS